MEITVILITIILAFSIKMYRQYKQNQRKWIIDQILKAKEDKNG